VAAFGVAYSSCRRRPRADEKILAPAARKTHRNILQEILTYE
jgi:hypothetical protein